MSLPRPSSPQATIPFLPCLPGIMLRAPLVSASPSRSPSRSPSQCPVQLSSPAACRKAQLQHLSFTFYDVHGVSERQTFPGQWPWQTAAAALVPAGHTKMYSSQLVLLSLWLNSWWAALFHVTSITMQLEDTARYAGLLLAPAEGFGLRPRLFLPFGQKKGLLCCLGSFLAFFGVQ